MNAVNDTRSTLEKYMPLLIGLLVAFLAAFSLIYLRATRSWSSQ